MGFFRRFLDFPRFSKELNDYQGFFESIQGNDNYYNDKITQIETVANAALPKAGGTMTGNITMNNNDLQGVNKLVASTQAIELESPLTGGNLVYVNGTSNAFTGTMMLLDSNTSAGSGASWNFLRATDSAEEKIRIEKDGDIVTKGTITCQGGNFGDLPILGVGNAVSGNQALNRNYLEGTGSAEADGLITARIHANDKQIVWLANGTNPQDAVNKSQLDLKINKANNENITEVNPNDIANNFRIPTIAQLNSKVADRIRKANDEDITAVNPNDSANDLRVPTIAQMNANLRKSGGTMTGQIDMDNINIIGVGALVAKTSNPITIQLSSPRTNASAPIAWVNSTANNIGSNSEILRISTATSASTSFRFLSCYSSGVADQELYIAQDGSIASDTGFIGSPADYAITLEKDESTILELGDLVAIENKKVIKGIKGLHKIIGAIRPKEGVSILENDIYPTTLKGDFDEYKNGERVKIRKLLESKSEKEPNKYVIVGIMGLIPVKKGQEVPDHWILIEEREMSNVYFVK